MRGVRPRPITLRTICWQCQIQEGATTTPRSFHISSSLAAEQSDASTPSRSERSATAFKDISRLPNRSSATPTPAAVDSRGRAAAAHQSRGNFSPLALRGRDGMQQRGERAGFEQRGGRGGRGGFQTRGGRGGRGGAPGRGRGRGRGGLGTGPRSRAQMSQDDGDDDEGEEEEDPNMEPTNYEMLTEDDEGDFANIQEAKHYGQVLDFIDAFFESNGHPLDEPPRNSKEAQAKRRKEGQGLSIDEMKWELQQSLPMPNPQYGETEEEDGAEYDFTGVADEDVRKAHAQLQINEKRYWDVGIRDALNHVIATEEEAMPRHHPAEARQSIPGKGEVGDIAAGAQGAGNVLEDDLRYLANRVGNEWQHPKELALKVVQGQFVKFRDLPEKREVLKLAEEMAYKPGQQPGTVNVGFEAPDGDARRALINRMVGGVWQDEKDKQIKGKFAQGVARLVGGNATYTADQKQMLLKTIAELLPQEGQGQRRPARQ